MGKITDAAVAIIVIIIGLWIFTRLGLTLPTIEGMFHKFFFPSFASFSTLLNDLDMILLFRSTNLFLTFALTLELLAAIPNMTIPEVVLFPTDPDEGKKNLCNIPSMVGRVRPNLVKIHSPMMITIMATAASVIFPISITPSLGQGDPVPLPFHCLGLFSLS